MEGSPLLLNDLEPSISHLEPSKREGWVHERENPKQRTGGDKGMFIPLSLRDGGGDPVLNYLEPSTSNLEPSKREGWVLERESQKQRTGGDKGMFIPLSLWDGGETRF
ncbi:hypothetical protein KIL84_002138 [Mauremys mutica]|uniref:Uncharacterized protein n=1 Tax=Mauremys mutica TaxID=74926 RepID=A0A9D3XIG6_9SAUR|nr:hypothetical protein KIL84_002138 [Mauremys mutica]